MIFTQRHEAFGGYKSVNMIRTSPNRNSERLEPGQSPSILSGLYVPAIDRLANGKRHHTALFRPLEAMPEMTLIRAYSSMYFQEKEAMLTAALDR